MTLFTRLKMVVQRSKRGTILSLVAVRAERRRALVVTPCPAVSFTLLPRGGGVLP
jgi:hypothetical protein